MLAQSAKAYPQSVFRSPCFTLSGQYCVTAGKSLTTQSHHVIAAPYRNIVTRSASELSSG